MSYTAKVSMRAPLSARDMLTMQSHVTAAVGAANHAVPSSRTGCRWYIIKFRGNLLLRTTLGCHLPQHMAQKEQSAASPALPRFQSEQGLDGAAALLAYCAGCAAGPCQVGCWKGQSFCHWNCCGVDCAPWIWQTAGAVSHHGGLSPASRTNHVSPPIRSCPGQCFSCQLRETKLLYKCYKMESAS